MPYLRKSQGAILAALMLFIGGANAQPNWQSGAWVLDVSGRAFAAGVPVKPATILSQDAILTADEETSVTMFLPLSQEQVVVTGPGEFRISTNKAVAIKGGQASVRTSRLSAQFPRLDASTEKTLGGVILRAGAGAASNDAQALVPDDEKVLAAGVRFSWPKQVRRAGYRFRLYDDKGSLVYEVMLDEEGILLPDSHHLNKGKEYVWEIEWQRPNGAKALNTERFTTLSEEEETFVISQRPQYGANEAEQRLYAMWLGAIGAKSLMRQAFLGLPDAK
jgi:hypothetical protein